MLKVRYDVIVVGGGLSGALAALRILELNKGISVAVLEREPTLGGNHTWCFFASDLDPIQRQFISPFVERFWDDYEVRFPGFSRQIKTGYAAITSRRFHDIMSQKLDHSVKTNARVKNLFPNGVLLDDGTTLEANCVLDARGPRPDLKLALGYQKFVALELELAEKHLLRRPVVMDATVDQHDGYRFMYSLPFDDRRILVYDTYYSDDRILPADILRNRIHDYARSNGWHVQSVLREEEGVLPIILGGDPHALVNNSADSVPRLGLGAGLFHPTTGYSLPDCIRVADLLAAEARRDTLTTDSARRALNSYRRDIWGQRSFFRMLNRMLFKAGAPELRYKVLERFYRMDEHLIRRFYAGSLNFADKLKLVVGKPPVPFFEALACVTERDLALSRRR